MIAKVPKGRKISKSAKYFSRTLVLARPSSVLGLKEAGGFDLKDLAIWLGVMPPLQVRLAYEETVVQDEDSRLCCYFKAGEFHVKQVHLSLLRHF